MQSQDKFIIFVSDVITPYLRGLRFRKSYLTWNRDKAGFTQVVNLQISRFVNPETIRFTINLGVFYPPVFEAVWGKRVPRFPKEHECCLRVRVGSVIQGDYSDQATDKWFEIDPSADLTEQFKEPMYILSTKAVPFLDNFTELTTIAEFLSKQRDAFSAQPLHSLNLAVILHELGQSEASLTILRNAYEGYAPWRTRCLSVARFLKLDMGLGQPRDS